MENYIINPISGRPILYNGAIHRRLIQNKQILQSPKKTVTKPKKTKQSNYESDCDENESDTETA